MNFKFSSYLCTLIAFLLLFFSSSVLSEQVSSDDEFASLLSELTVKSFNKKSITIDKIIDSEHERSLLTLQQLLDGELYYVKKTKRIVTIQKSEEGLRAFDAMSNADMGVFKKRKLKKISINNALRSKLRVGIAKRSLFNSDRDIRLEAVKNIIKDPAREDINLLNEAFSKENDDRIREHLQLGLALLKVDYGNQEERLTAVNFLGQTVSNEATSRLKAFLEKDDDGEFIETDSALRQAAREALQKIEFNIRYYEVIETIFFGLSAGSVLLLAAIGLAITFGVMRVINMAHGELIMIGAYTTFVIQQLMPNSIEYSLFVAIPAAFIVSGLVGIAIERGVVRHLYGRPLETLLATFGISLILQQAVRTIFSPLNQSVETPQWMSGAWEINSALSITYNRLYIIIFSLMVFFFLLGILKKTRLGLQVRAVTQNRQMARAMGVRSGWVDALTFGLGSGIAGVAGVALSQLTNVGPNLGQAYIIDSFMVVVFGGVGNLWGTLVGAMSLGVINKFLEPWSGAVLAKILVLVLIILFIQKRPSGLFPQKGRAAAED